VRLLDKLRGLVPRRPMRMDPPALQRYVFRPVARARDRRATRAPYRFDRVKRRRQLAAASRGRNR
jgi:hypothetical protein